MMRTSKRHCVKRLVDLEITYNNGKTWEYYASAPDRFIYTIRIPDGAKARIAEHNPNRPTQEN